MDESAAPMTAIYDMQMNPASYDFLAFLASADRERQRLGRQGMDVHFIPGEHSRFYDGYYPKSNAEREGLLWRVCVPATRLVKSVKSVHVYSVRQSVGGDWKYPQDWKMSCPSNTHGSTFLVGAAKCLDASDQAKSWVVNRYKGNYFTITLRECEYDAPRNSDRVDWYKLAKIIENAGGKVIFVPDTYGRTLHGFPNCIEASWDIDIRCALYQRAILNMGVANGPMSVAILSKSRYAMINTENRELNIDGNTVHPNIPPTDLMPWIEPYLRAAA